MSCRPVALVCALAVCAPAQARWWGLEAQAQGSLSGIGFNGIEAADPVAALKVQGRWSQHTELAAGWRQNFKASLRLDTAGSDCPLSFCGKPPTVEASAVFGYSHYAWGNVLLGRTGSLAAGLAQSASAFDSDSIGADRCQALLAKACPRLRPISLTWEMPTFLAWTPSLQLASGEGPTAVTTRLDANLLGGRVMAAYVHLSGHEALIPLGLELPLGRWRLHALLVHRKEGTSTARFASAGLSTPLAGGTARLQMAEVQNTKNGLGRKASLGYERAWSLRETWFLDIARLERPARPVQSALALGMRWVTP